MDEDTPKIVSFQNPIDPDALAITAHAEIALLPSADGGLKQPLRLPTPSLLFRVPGSEPVLGYTAVVESAGDVELKPGSAAEREVTFVGVPRGEVWDGRVFALWQGHDVGTAKIVRVIEQ